MFERELMIPKVLHYIWFGGSELPELERKCIESWSKIMPDWEIRRWDESNFDINQCDFSREAYASKNGRLSVTMRDTKYCIQRVEFFSIQMLKS